MKIQKIVIVAFICTLLLMFPLPVVGAPMADQAEFRGVAEEWSQVFGGSEYEWGNSVTQTSDGGYIVAGTTYSYGAGNGDIWLIKTDADGNQEWDQTFGGSDEDHGDSVAQTSDGGYIIAASTQSYGAGSSDVWLIKTDASGNEQWSELFGGSEWDFGESVAQTSDGGYIITGCTESYGAGGSDAWLIKTDASGSEEWNELFGGSSYDYGYSVVQTSDGGYIITGYTQSYGTGAADVWLIKTDADGVEEWDQTFGGSGADFGYSVVQTSDGGYIVVGYTYSYGVGSADVWLIKTDASGSEEWNELFGGSSYDGGYSVAKTSDGGYIVAGDTVSYGNGGSDVWLIKLSDSDPQVTPGDGNGDGAVNALDITKVERVIVALDTETPGSDANGDGNINAMDITKIELIIAGLD